jgi:hypothetical protein
MKWIKRRLNRPHVQCQRARVLDCVVQVPIVNGGRCDVVAASSWNFFIRQDTGKTRDSVLDEDGELKAPHGK